MNADALLESINFSTSQYKYINNQKQLTLPCQPIQKLFQTYHQILVSSLSVGWQVRCLPLHRKPNEHLKKYLI